MDTNDATVRLVDGVIHFQCYQNSPLPLSLGEACSSQPDSPNSTISELLGSSCSSRMSRLFEDKAENICTEVELEEATSYNIFIKLRKFPKQGCDVVLITLEQRGGVNDEETKAVSCLMDNVWRTRVGKLDGLRLSIRNATWPNSLSARFNLTGLQLGRKHQLTNAHGISVSVVVEPVLGPTSNALTGYLNIKLLGGENFPHLNDDSIGSVSVVFLHSGQQITSSNDSGTSCPRWEDVMRFKMLDLSERNVTVLLLRTDRHSGRMEEVARQDLDFAERSEEDVHYYKLKLTRVDDNPVFIKFYLSYGFGRQLPWLETDKNMHEGRDGNLGEVKVDIYYWTPLSSGLQNSLLYLVVRCGNNYAVTKSTTRANQRPCHSVRFPLTDLVNTIEIRAYEDGLYECKEIGRLLLPLSTLPLPVTEKLRTPDLRRTGPCEMRYQTTLRLDGIKYIRRCFQPTRRVTFSPTHDRKHAADGSLEVVSGLMRLKENGLQIIGWKDKLVSVFVCAITLVVSRTFELYHVPLLVVILLLKELAMITIFTRSHVSFSRTPLVITALVRGADLKRAILQGEETYSQICSCCDNMRCHEPRKHNSHFHTRSPTYDFVYLHDCWRSACNFVYVTFLWVAPLYSLTLLVLAVTVAAACYTIPLHNLVSLLFIHLFTKKFYNCDVFWMLFNFVMNAPSRRELALVSSV